MLYQWYIVCSKWEKDKTWSSESFFLSEIVHIFCETEEKSQNKNGFSNQDQSLT